MELGYASVQFSDEDVSLPATPREPDDVPVREEALETKAEEPEQTHTVRFQSAELAAAALASQLECAPRERWPDLIKEALAPAAERNQSDSSRVCTEANEEKGRNRAGSYKPGCGIETDVVRTSAERRLKQSKGQTAYELEAALMAEDAFEEEEVLFSDEEEEVHSYSTPVAEGREGEEEGKKGGKESKRGKGVPAGPEGAEDWNMRFQAAVTRIHSLSSDETEETKTFVHSQLSDLASDFVSSATVYGKIIIAEINTPLHLKTIRPASLGGLVGGDKYIVRGILFKFPTSGDSDDAGGLYGEEAAAKVAKHELRGLAALYGCNVPGVHFPMMALIDYLGFRLIAMTLLPLEGPSSLVYGSNDAGRTVHMEIDEAAVAKLRQISSKLNLKPHMAGVGSKRALVFSPADLEGHIGKDGRLYLLDFSRTFPPESPKKGVQGSHLFRLLRPELVRTNAVPLCSDAFSGFVMVREEAVEHNHEVHEATAALKEAVIPRVAETLNKLSEHGLKQYFRDNKMLVEVLHSNGINLRHVGLLRRALRSDFLRTQVLVEMVARVVKQALRRKLRGAVRQLQFPSAHMNRRIVVHELSSVFGTVGSHWRSSLVPRLLEMYEGGLEEHEAAPGFDLRASIAEKGAMGVLLQRVLLLSGVRCTGTCLELALAPNSTVFDCANPFDATDIESLEATVHHLPFVDSSTGFVLKTKAKRRLRDHGQEDPTFLHLCTAAVRKFELALYSEPRCPFTLSNYADTLYLLRKYRRAYSYYQLALVAGDSPDVLLSFSIFLLNIGRYKEGENAMRRLLEANNHSLHCVKRIMQETSTTGNVDEVHKLLKSVCKRNGSSVDRLVSLAETELEQQGNNVPRGTRLVHSFSFAN